MMSIGTKHADVVVVGYGNTLRQDDGFGPIVADKLRERLKEARVRIFTRQLLTVELVADLEFAGLCVLIDAATTGQAGTLCIRDVTPEHSEPATLGHDLSAASLIGLTQRLTGSAPRCILVSAVPEAMELGEGLSDAVAHLVEPAVDGILARIAAYFTAASGCAPT